MTKTWSNSNWIN